MNAYEIARAEATRVVEAAYHKAVAAGELPEGSIPPVAVETPKDSSNGDWASTFAMQCAKPLHMAPRKIAEASSRTRARGQHLRHRDHRRPGLHELTLNQSWYEKAVRGVFEMGENYGRTKAAKPEKVMVEFVSANPTGPMHMGNARGGVLGDCLSSVLDWSGNDVTREFYINDAGNQVDKFAHSVEGRYIQEVKGEDAIEFDASWYQGDDIKRSRTIWSGSTATVCLKRPRRSASPSSRATACRPISRAWSATSSATRSIMTSGSASPLCTRAATSRRPSIC